MRPLVYRATTQVKYQAPVIVLACAAIAFAIWNPIGTPASLSGLDQSSYLTFMSGIATVLALFCSLSIAWILAVLQRNKSERVAAYDLLKSRLSELQRWLLEQPATADRELTLALVHELSKHDLSDLPQTDLGDEYREYAAEMEKAFDGDDGARRRFYLITSSHVGYFEQLLSRIGMVSIRQVITSVFLDTLAKGIFLVACAVLTLIAASIWYGPTAKPILILLAAFIGFGAVFLLVELFVDMKRLYEEEDLDFIDRGDGGDSET
jgi:hypothetical protein